MDKQKVLIVPGCDSAIERFRFEVGYTYECVAEGDYVSVCAMKTEEPPELFPGTKDAVSKLTIKD